MLYQRQSSVALKSTAAVFPNCGKSLGEITRTGFCGCPECYRVFAEYLQPLFGKREVRHRGRVPAGEKKNEYLERAQILAKEMEFAYERGDAERVKVLTEELRRLKAALSEEKQNGGQP